MEISLRHIRKIFGSVGDRERGVQDISLDAAGGAVYGILGHNGAGKTTVLRLLLDILHPQAGEILVDGDPHFNRTQAFRCRVGYLPEERGLYRHRTVADTLLYLASLKGISAVQAEAALNRWLEEFQLSEFKYEKIGRLSKGQAQKIQLVAALLHDPALLILDEPFGGLDALAVREVRSLVEELKNQGKVILLSTHLLSQAEMLCDHVLLIARGREIARGTVLEICRRYSPCDVKAVSDSDLSVLQSCREVTRKGKEQYIKLAPGCTFAQFLAELAEKECAVDKIERQTVSLEDVFAALMQGA